MELRQLKSFIAIAETGTFTAGAARVYVTQAAISVQIRTLETETGTKLFIRTPRRVLLTEAGEALLERARKILREHDAALSELAEIAGAKRGRLRIGSASAMISGDALPRLLREIRRRHPPAELIVTSGTSDALVKLLLAGELDLAFVSLPIDAVGIEAETLSSDELVAIAHPQHRLAKQKVVTAETLASEPLILGERGGNTRRLIDKFFEEAKLSPEVQMELPRQQAIVRMVEEGLGLGIVPSKSAANEVESGKLVRWWIKGAQAITWQLGLARLSGGYDSPIMQTFIELCRAEFLEKNKSRKPTIKNQNKSSRASTVKRAFRN